MMCPIPIKQSTYGREQADSDYNGCDHIVHGVVMQLSDVVIIM